MQHHISHLSHKFSRGFSTVMLSAAFLLTFSVWQNVNAAPVCRANAIAKNSNPDAKPPLPEHPRILIDKTQITQLKKLITDKDATALTLLANVTTHVKWILAHFPNPYPIPAPDTLSLTTAREIQDIIATNAGLFMLTGNTTYSNRAIAEMLQVAKYPDWNPTNFLVTAETTQAMAMGYDWVFSKMTPAQRLAIRNAIMNNGLQPGLIAFRQGAYDTPNSNWTAVVNGGLLNGLLAIDNQNTTVTKEILPYLKANLTAVSSMYAPAGGWVEGPGYFMYATKYYTYAVASLLSTLGTDWSLGTVAGYGAAGNYATYSDSPTTLSFNYGDAGDAPVFGGFMAWLSRQFKNPVFGINEYAVISTPSIASDEIYNSEQNSDFIMDLLWYDSCMGVKPSWPFTDYLSNGDAASGNALVFLRAAFGDSQAFSVGLKGGNNVGSGHSHADLGSFVLDALGVRWGLLLGGESYSLPNMFPGGGVSLPVWNERLYYYRNSTAGANTLSINNTYQTAPSFNNQYGFGVALVTGFLSKPGTLSYGVVDLTNAYSNVVANNIAIVNSAKRGIAIIEDSNVLVRDEVRASAPVDVVWNFHTAAQISINASGTVATLKDPVSGNTLVATLLTPMNGAYFSIASVDPDTVNLPYSWTGKNGCTAAANTWVDTIGCIESTNAGTYNLVVRNPQTKMSAANTIQVVFNPTGIISADVQSTITKLGPLSNWIAMGPVSPPN